MDNPAGHDGEQLLSTVRAECLAALAPPWRPIWTTVPRRQLAPGHVDAAGSGVASRAGGMLPVEAVRVSGIDRALSAGLVGWRKSLAVHDPAKVVLDVAVGLALSGDGLADIALLRAEPGLFGAVASDPTVSRTIAALAADAPRTLGRNDTYGYALAAQPDQSQGRPTS